MRSTIVAVRVGVGRGVLTAMTVSVFLLGRLRAPSRQRGRLPTLAPPCLPAHVVE
jgi:hypothetical protein